MKKLFLYSVALLFALAACVKEEPVAISFKNPEYHMNVGDTLNLADEMLVANYDKFPVLEASADSIVDLKVDGRLIALAKGETMITAKAGGIEAACKVIISDVPLQKVTLVAPESIVAGEVGVTVTAQVEPKGYNPANLIWKFEAAPATLEIEAENVRAYEYKVKVKDFEVGARLSVIVSGKDDAAIADTVVMNVVKEAVTASRIILEMPKQLTGGVDGLSATVKATTEPEEYDIDNLEWKFTPSDGLEYTAEKMGNGEYKVSFGNYVRDGRLLVEVKDAFSETFNEGEIKVLEKPVDGAASLFFKSDRMTLYLGDKAWTPELICEPFSYDPYLLKWSMSDETVAKLENGMVTPLKEGDTDLIVRDVISGKEAICEISVVQPVEDVEISKIIVSPSNLHMKLDEDVVQLMVECIDVDGNSVKNYAGLEWSAAPMMDAFEQPVTIVEVSNRGVVTPKNPGTTQITVKDRNNANIYAMCEVFVVKGEIKVEEVKLSRSSMVVALGRSVSLEASVLPREADNQTIVFSSSDDKIVSVDDEGVVTGVALGEADVYATAANGVKATCHVKVEERAIFLDMTDIIMAKGAKKTFVLTKLPEDGFSGQVAWTSSNADVATVAAGVVTAVKAGETKITASLDGFTAECAVKVADNDFNFDIYLDYSDPSVEVKGLQQDEQVRLIPEFRHNETGKVYIPASTSWTSSDRSLATVGADGTVTAVKEEIGSYGLLSDNKVTITFNADGVEASVGIFVVKAQPREIVIKSMPSVNGVEGRIMHGESFRFETEVLPAKAIQAVGITKSNPDGGYGGVLTDGVFYAASVGVYSLMFYVETADGSGSTGSIESITRSISIEVLPVPVESFTITGASSLDLEVGDEVFLATEILPANASYKTITWESGAEEVVSVRQDGKIRAVAAGETTVTGTLPEGQTVVYTVSVKVPVRPALVGDYYYSDGTTSTEYDASKTAVGIVFSTQNITLQDSGLPAGCKNGLVVSLEEASTAWQSSAVSVNNWLRENEGYQNITNYELACGYSNTLALKAYNEANPDTKVLPVELAPSVGLPSATSGWYLPSLAELGILAEAYGAIKDKFEAAGGVVPDATAPNFNIGDGGGQDTYRYWASTESANSSSQACTVQFSDGKVQNNMLKSKSYYRVRYIFAF